MNAYRTPQKQKGSVLIITMIVLLMLTIMAVTEVSFNSTQTRIATNTGDKQVAFQTAQGALNDATNNLLANTYTNFAANTNGLYTLVASSAPRWTTINWSSPSSVIMSFQGSSSAQAAFFIEQLPSVIQSGQNFGSATVFIYRITVRAVGASGQVPVILQSTVQMQQ